jgi:NAD+ diphosphatase
MRFFPSAELPAATTDLAWCLAFVDGKVLLPDAAAAADAAVAAAATATTTASASLAPRRWAELEPFAAVRHYLGRLDELDCWVCTLATVPAGWRALPLRAAMMQLPDPLMALAGRAAQVLEWDRAHRYCGVCGTPTELQAAERARLCPACKHVAYPRLSPAMMALVWRSIENDSGPQKELLLARAPHFTPGMYSALAGFVEPGESLEECVIREVAEEVGVRVANLQYYGSQSWPFPHSLMVAYTAEWVSGDIVRQESEIEAAAWFPIDALPPIPPRFSISGHLIRDTAAALRNTAG